MRGPEPAKKGRAGRRDRRAPEGGKALARLRQFEGERALVESDVVKGKADRPLAADAKAATRDTTKRAREAYPYLAAFEQLNRLSRAAPAMPVAQGWRPLGPYSVPHGQTYGSGPGSRPSVTGRLAAVAVDPGDASHILIGAAGGGVWETKDGGTSWEPRTDNQPSLAIGAIAFDPSNPLTVYAGTGEGNFYARLGTGLLRSTDGGTNWTVHATAPFVSIGFYAIVVDPLNGNHLLAATTGGLFESTNGGTTWTQRRAARTWDLSMHPVIAGVPTSTQEVLAACQDGLYRSTDGGTTWSSLALPGPPTAYQRLAVRHAPSDGDVAYAFAAGTGGSGHLWRRAAFAGAFAAATLPANLATGQAWYDWFLAVAPNNPDVVYLGEIEVRKGVRSPTNTWTWTTISATTGDSIHPDQHAIDFSPTDPNVVFVGNDGGLYRSPDAGTTWRSLNKGLCVTEFEYLAQHPLWEAYLLGGTQDNGTLRYEGEEVWYHVQDGDGGDCGLNASAPATCFHTFYNMGMERSTTGGGWGSWSWVGPNPPAGYSSLFYPPVEVNGSVVAQAGTSVFISLNNGTAWTQVGLPQPAANVATALAIPTTTRVYAGTAAGHIYRIDFTGGAWGAPTQLTRPRAGFVSDVVADPTNPNRLWATYSNVTGGHVYRSDNGGTNWTDVSAGLPTIPFNAIVVDPAAPDTVYVAADVGVYRSTNAGGTWAAFNNLLPNVLVADLTFFEPLRLLRAGTRNRGVWEINVDAPTMPDVQLYLRDSVVDTGRRSPSPSGVNDPFSVGSLTHWWQCTDIKVDAPGYQTPAATDVDFERFEDDHGVSAGGLIHENAQRGKIARVYVQLHNRGSKPAANVAVKVFYADASLGLPDLPTGFWTNFPNNTLPATSPWKAIAAHKVVPSVEVDLPQVVSFDWPVPASAASHTCLLAIVDAPDDPIGTTERIIAPLVVNNPKAGLKNLTVVDPPPGIGPRVLAVLLNLWRQGRWTTYQIGVDRRSAAMVAGIVLSKRLSEAARAQGAERVKLTTEQTAEVQKIIRQRPALRDVLDTTGAYVPAARGPWLKSLALDARRPEPIVVLVSPRPRPGKWSIVQWAEDGTEVGGFTLQALGRQ